MNRKNCAIIISSCDAFDDIWHPFFTLFFRYWPDCPFPVYLISNYKKYDDSRVETISVGEDKGWATNMKTALKQIPTPYVLAMLDDLFLEQRVDTEYVDSLVGYITEVKAVYIRLFPSPFPDKLFSNTLNLGEISKDVPYRTSLQASIWDKYIFCEIIKDGETAWDMEINGSIRSNKIDAPFLSVKEPGLCYNPRTAVIRGKWNYDVIKFCRRNGIEIRSQRLIDYKQFIATSIDRFRKNKFSRALRGIPIIGYLGVIVLKITRKITNK